MTRQRSLLPLCCFSINKKYEGGAIDCQRAIASETLGFTISIKWVADASYEIQSDRYTGFRQIRRGMQYTTPFAGPYISAKSKKEREEDPFTGDRRTTHNEARFKYGARLPADGAYVEVEHVKEGEPSNVNLLPTHRTKLGYGTRVRGGNYAVERETQHVGGRLTKSDLTTTVTVTATTSTGESGTYTTTTTKDFLPAVAEERNDPPGESYSSVRDAVVPAVATEDSITATPHSSVPVPSTQEAHETLPAAAPWSHRPYITIGIFNRKTGLAREKITRLQRDHSSFGSIRTASWRLWPIHKRLFSLKSISGFGLYHCHVESGYHSAVEIDDRTKQTLFEFYLDYKHDAPGMDQQWMDWIHEHLNGSSADPREGNYTLELLLRWSVTKIMIYGLLPVIGSLVVGVAYMQIRMRGAEDFGSGLAVVQTAWGIASYVVGAAGGKMFQILKVKERLMKLLQLRLLSWVSLHSWQMRRSGRGGQCKFCFLPFSLRCLPRCLYITINVVS
jgi:hypothetical protein